MTDQTPIASTIRHEPVLSACLAGSRRGWTPERKTQFLDRLASDGSVSAACARVGMSREAAYRLRRREALFARGWDAALVLARAVSAEALASRALDGVEEDVWYRGELVGTRRKYDSRLLLAHMARLDRIAESPGAAHDAGRFDEILALVGGEPVPPEAECDEDGMPANREDHTAIAVEDAEAAFGEAWLAQNPPCAGEEDGDEFDPATAEAREEREIEADTAYREALNEERRTVSLAAGTRWDGWRARAHAAADRLLAQPHAAGEAATAEAAPGTLSQSSTSPAEAAAGAGQDGVKVVAPVSPSPLRGSHPFGVTYARA